MTDLDVYQPAAVDGYQARMVMTPDQARALDDQLTQCINAILHEGTDYGIIPGTKEKSLWRPGAQKLLLWFGLGFTCDRIDIDADEDGQRLGVTYRATVTRRLPDGTHTVVTTCEGYAGYDEDKFYQSEEQVKAKLRDQEHKWAAKDHRVPNADRWNNAREYRAPWNTVIKRAQKRAIVGAVLDATAAGGRFNQDREEDDHAPAAQDDGPSWYERGVEAAYAFDITDKKAGDKIFTGAATAFDRRQLDRRQKDHIQNIVRKRQAQQKNAKVVDADALARQDAAGEPEDGDDGGDMPHA